MGALEGCSEAALGVDLSYPPKERVALQRLGFGPFPPLILRVDLATDTEGRCRVSGRARPGHGRARSRAFRWQGGPEQRWRCTALRSGRHRPRAGRRCAGRVRVSPARPEARGVAGRQERVARRSSGEAMSGMRREPDLARKGGEGRVMTQSVHCEFFGFGSVWPCPPRRA